MSSYASNATSSGYYYTTTAGNSTNASDSLIYAIQATVYYPFGYYYPGPIITVQAEESAPCVETQKESKCNRKTKAIEKKLKRTVTLD